MDWSVGPAKIKDRIKKRTQKFRLNLRGEHKLGDGVVDWRFIVKRILKEWYINLWTRFNWPYVDTAFNK
jgi:hypothetical protein